MQKGHFGRMLALQISETLCTINIYAYKLLRFFTGRQTYHIIDAKASIVCVTWVTRRLTHAHDAGPGVQ